MSRAEEYLRRMRALGYEPSLAGMDDEDIEWELNRMDGAGRHAARAEQPLYTRYKPVDPGLAARIFRQMGRPYDPSAIDPRESFYIGGWDNWEDKIDTKPVAKPWPEPGWDEGIDLKPVAKPGSAAVIQFSEDGNNNSIGAEPQAPQYRPRDSFTLPTRGAADRPLSFGPSGQDVGAPMKIGEDNPNAGGYANGGAEEASIDQSGVSGGSHYLLFSREDQRFYWIDARTGEAVNSWTASDKFVPGKNEKGEPRESLPVGSYQVSSEITDGKYGPAYGNFYITTGDPRNRDVHGGGSALEDPYAPYHKLTPTHGCLRMQNAEGVDLSKRILGQGNKALLVVINGPARLGGNDLR